MTEGVDWSPRFLFTVGFFVELALVLIAAAIGLMVEGTPFPFSLTLDATGMLWGLVGTVPLGALAFALTSPLARQWPPIQRIYEKVTEILGSALLGLGVMDLLLLAAAAGIGEEVLFRGVLQTVLGIWATSIVFGLLHALTPTYFLLAAGIGVYLGFLMQYTDNLLAPILVHWIYDSIALILIQRRHAMEQRTVEPPEAPE
jgi:uncharacterized protein